MKRKLKLKPSVTATRKKRTIRVGDAQSAASQAEYQERSAVKLVQSHPRYAIILASLKEGIPPTDIARWFAVQNWIEISERAFLNALYIFRKRMVHLLKADADSLDGVAEGDRPDLDATVELNRLLRVQKERIAIDFKTEKGMGKLFNNTHKEMQVAAELIELMLKANERGSKGAGSGYSFSEDLPVDVREKLRSIRVDEEKRNRVHSLVQDFAKRVSHAQKENSSTSA